jgi:hypothetical protein
MCGGVRRFGFCGQGLELISAASPSFSQARFQR